jgi:hypothetical protein
MVIKGPKHLIPLQDVTLGGHEDKSSICTIHQKLGTERGAQHVLGRSVCMACVFGWCVCVCVCV